MADPLCKFIAAFMFDCNCTVLERLKTGNRGPSDQLSCLIAYVQSMNLCSCVRHSEMPKQHPMPKQQFVPPRGTLLYILLVSDFQNF